MTTPTPHGAPELPAACPFCDHSIMHMRSVGKMQQAHCAGCGAAGPLFTEARPAIAAWNRRAIQQAAGAVPEGVLAAAKAANKHWNEFGPLFCFDECMDTLDRALAASPSPLGREAGSSDHLVPCAGGGVTQPLTEDQILDHVVAVWPGGANTRGILEFTRAIEAAHGINPGPAPREDGHG